MQAATISFTALDVFDVIGDDAILLQRFVNRVNERRFQVGRPYLNIRDVFPCASALRLRCVPMDDESDDFRHESKRMKVSHGPRATHPPSPVSDV